MSSRSCCPDLPPEDQAEIVARLWEVSHPGVTSFLTALSDHHPVPAVATGGAEGGVQGPLAGGEHRLAAAARSGHRLAAWLP